MSRTDVPIGIRRSVVQIEIERTTISVIVAIAVTIGERALNPYSLYLKGRRVSPTLLRSYPSQERGLQEGAAPMSQSAIDGAWAR